MLICRTGYEWFVKHISVLQPQTFCLTYKVTPLIEIKDQSVRLSVCYYIPRK